MSLKLPRAELLKLAVPVISSGILSKVASMIAVIFLGMISKDQLAASSLAFNSFLTVFTIATAVFFATGILCGHALGKSNNHEKEISAIFKTGICIAILIGLPMSVLMWHLDKLLYWCHQDKVLIKITAPYFHIMAIGLVPTMFNALIVHFYIGLSRAKIALYKTLIGLPFIIIFSYIFILGKFGLPQFGLGGLAIAITIAQILTCIALFVYLYLDKTIQQYQLFNFNHIYNKTIAKKMLTLGAPIGLQFGAELGAITLATYFLGHFGVNALAAGQVVSQYITLLIMVILGLSQALSVLTSKAFGNKDFNKVIAYRNSAFQLVSFCFIFIGIAFFFFPTLLTMPFVNLELEKNIKVLNLAKIFFYIAAVSFYIDSLRNMLTASLRGLHSSVLPMVVSTLCLWGLSIPICYLIGNLLNSAALLRAGFASGIIVAGVILYLAFQRKLKELS